LKRAFPQKVKPVSCHPSASANDAEVGQSRQPLLGVNRKARTSAAMIGLALSMGASSLLIPRQSDGASAAESMATESTVEVVPLAYHVAVLPAQGAVEVSALVNTPDSSTVSHVVNEGETLWRIARMYRVSVRAIATANGISDDAVIRVGQTLNVPASASSSRRAALTARASSPLASSSVQLTESNIDASDVAKAQRESALQRLRQERDKLRSSLTDLRSSSSPYSTATPPKDRRIASGSQTRRPTEHSPASSPSPEAAEIQSTETVPTSDSASAAVTSTNGGLTHQVKPGETLGSIARTYRVSPQDLISLNHLSNPDQLGVHQEIAIPVASPSQDTASAELPEPKTPEATVATTAEPTVPQPESATAASSVVYRVNPGDTLGEIAQAYSIPETSLVHANQLNNPNLIVVGQVLQIPADNLTASAGNATTMPTATIPANSVTEQFRPEGFASSLLTDSQVQESVGVNVPTVPEVKPEAQDVSLSEPVDIDSLSNAAPTAVDASAEPSQTSQQVATASLAEPSPGGSPKSSQETATPGSNPYVAQLMSEILAMRDRYRAANSSEAQPQQPVVVAATPEAVASPLNSSAVNPEFRSASYLESSNAQSSGFQSRTGNEDTSRSASDPTPAEAPQRPQLLATAPLGSENYEPLLQPVAGQLVSPDLPPLPGAEAFLPNSSPSFDGFIWPSRGVLSSGYGWRWGRMHRGIDIAAPIGTPVHAAAGGTIQFSAWNSGGYGNMIEIRHPDGTMTRYAHLSRNLVRAGQQVEQGQQIGLVGSTGYSTGPHLHFEVHLPNQGTVNPIAYLPGR
jgi:murein DD-endopeptidase MepM/ murein hydrolase activator NlpD